jgi:DNA-binding FadR family transcriptional regulator
VGIEIHRRVVDLLATGRVTEANEELRKHIESHKERLI